MVGHVWPNTFSITIRLIFILNRDKLNTIIKLSNTNTLVDMWEKNLACSLNYIKKASWEHLNNVISAQNNRYCVCGCRLLLLYFLRFFLLATLYFSSHMGPFSFYSLPLSAPKIA